MSHKRDALFLTLTGVFLTSLVLGNVIGTTKFVTIFSINLPSWLHIIPELVRDGSVYSNECTCRRSCLSLYFLATDLISELFGRKKAQLVVWVGFAMNVFMLFLMTVNHWLPNAGSKWRLRFI